GMNQALTDMQRDMGPIWLGPGTLAQTSAAVAKAAADADHDLAAAGGSLRRGRRSRGRGSPPGAAAPPRSAGSDRYP
ncbi:MAG TPA: hypothetical protein VFV41_01525, partial [Streptosporangiaceae bacterium]|nr:hypothetical protein [Streptosporangiaceae bacterium]